MADVAVPQFSPQMPPTLPRMSHPAPNVTADRPQQSGTLQIVDHFTPSIDPNGPLLPSPNGGPPMPVIRLPHGINVTDSALGTGIQRPVNTSEFGAPSDPIAWRLLGFPNMQPEAALQALDTAVAQDHLGVAVGAAQSLQNGLRAGVTNSVTNFSMAASPANTTEHIYQSVRSAWLPAPESPTPDQQAERFRGQNISDNLARAWNINPSDLSSSDPAVSGPARARFQQHLIDRTGAVPQSEPVQQARELVNGIVGAYEGNRNSVVVAAGNNGDLLPQMMADNGGRPLITPEGFFENILATPNVTTVGALEATGPGPGQVGVAGYSSPSREVDMYAWGQAPNGASGTSFSAPRVAMMMQEEHLRNPNATSAEVEEIVRRRCFPGSLPSEQAGCSFDMVR
jgi:hypothetical protein